MRQGCKVIEFGDATAIICGGEPTDHKCNEDLSILILDDDSRVKHTDEFYEKNYKRVRGGSVACSICGRAAIDNANYL